MGTAKGNKIISGFHTQEKRVGGMAAGDSLVFKEEWVDTGIETSHEFTGKRDTTKNLVVEGKLDIGMVESLCADWENPFKHPSVIDVDDSYLSKEPS